MSLFQLRLNTRCIGLPWRPRLPLYCALFFAAIFLQPAKASFVGDYALSNFTLTNSSSILPIGSATTPDNGLTVIITGPNNGSGDPGTTDLTIAAAASGQVQFDYSYSTLDDPQLDFAWYQLGGSFIQIADQDGASGSVQFMVNAGDIFGFRVSSLDNLGEPGILTISGFSAPSSASPVPEPDSVILIGIGAIAVVCISQTRRKRAKS